MTKPVHALGLLIMLKMTAATNPSSAPVQCADRNLRCAEWAALGLCTDADFNMRLYVREPINLHDSDLQLLIRPRNCHPGWWLLGLLCCGWPQDDYRTLALSH